ncbi:MAG: type VII secretion protein EccE [Mycobacterium sp.]|uniref:type VII secretion protein EccE n=1 Tax=Mycobacterium sp. TaxID=1785 RepID=UPI003F9B9F0D
MNSPLGLRFSTGHALWFAALAPPCLLLLTDTPYWRVGVVVVVLGALVAFVTFFGRRATGWLTTAWAWLRRRRKPPDSPSEPVVGATVKPGDHVAVRWQGEDLVSVIELIPRPFTPTVIVDGQAHTDDVLDTRLLEDLLSVHCPDLQADVVSAGHRAGSTASAEVASLYRQLTGADPAPANRRTWIMLRAQPERTRKSARLRAEGVAGLARYLVASATRIADQLASHGVDAVCGRSFDDYDRATDVGFVRERWSTVLGHNGFTAAYAAPGGPDLWWSAPAGHTITRVRVAPGQAPLSTVLLTTATNPTTPRGFSRLFGCQGVALQGQNLVASHHCQLPIGSAGVLIGETANRCPVYMPFDDVDASITLGDAQAFAQFASRSAAAGGIVTVGAQFAEFAQLIGAHVGPVPKVAWPTATTYLGRHPGIDRVVLRHNLISTPRHPKLPIRRVAPPEESRYQAALPR